jgi:DeoR/GlpR family transcriptional regulator of sugar metabolism
MGESSQRSFADRRREMIVSEARRHGVVRVTELATLFDVSEMTVRRDLDALDDAGLVTKVHGGATVRYAHSSEEPRFEAKALRNTDEKQAIAASAAVLVEAGSAIGITAGTTTMRLAQELVNLPRLTVVTNNVGVSDVFALQPRTDRTVVLVGGVRTPSDALVGPLAVSALRTFHLDKVFMGVHGMHPRAGFTTPNLLEAETNRAFVDAAEELVVTADHTKWGVTGLATIVSLSGADVCITDTGIADRERDALDDQVGRLILSSADHYRSARQPPDRDATPVKKAAESGSTR